jgi:opacity protein-like surface antigen
MNKLFTLSKVVLMGVVLSVVAVGAHAQDSTSNSNVQTAAAVFGEPGASPATPAARPAHWMDMGSGITLFAGYSFLDNGYPTDADLDFDTFGRSGIHGWAFSGTWMFNNNFGLTADFSGHSASPSQAFDCDGDCTLKIDQDFYSFLFGPTVVKSVGKVNLFAHGLVGVSHAGIIEKVKDCPSCTYFTDDLIPGNTGISFAVGGGADYMFTKHFGWRIAQFDYIWSDLQQCGVDDDCDGFGFRGSVNNIRISTGLVIHVGGSN